MKIAIALYPGFTALDVVGPFQVLTDVPGHEVCFVGEAAGLVPDHTGRCPLVATETFDEFDAADVVIIGGALEDHEPDAATVAWLRKIHPTTTWTTSVCTGSSYLAAAGILDGRTAACHWARTERLESYDVTYTSERVVVGGDVITAAGVSSGIDMALRLLSELHGDDVARSVQLAVEYDPQPPFDSGSVATAPPEIVELVRATLG